MSNENNAPQSSASTGTSAATTSSAAQEKSPASTVDMYEIVSTIGKGSFGTVSKIRRKADGRVSNLRKRPLIVQTNTKL
jgi:hypothetical protein